VDGAPLVSTHAAAQFIYATLKKHGTVRQLLLTAFQELAVTTDVLPGQIRNRIDQLQHVLQQYGYARATQAHMDRKMDGLVLLALLQQSFKSYADFATALLRLLEDGAVFAKHYRSVHSITKEEAERQEAARVLLSLNMSG
jgi:tRNA nucleotidyltransferase (CCA-adding enzyme)